MVGVRRPAALAGFLAAIALLVPGCTGDPVALSSAGPEAFGAAVLGFGDWNGALPDTSPVPPSPLPDSVLSAPDGDAWVCQRTEEDLKRNLDELLAPGMVAGVLWPGALIQGATLIAGDPASLPLPRSPISISIDLAVEHPSQVVGEPTSASVQEAVATLQREADSRLGAIDVVPARVDFEMTEADATFQFLIQLGMYAKGSVPASVLGLDIPGTVSVGVQGNSGAQVSFQRHTVAVRLIQPMYTVSFADEGFASPDDYLDPTVTPAQVQGAMDRGMLGANNLPTYVKSVTYGRMVMFTITNTFRAEATELQSSVQAALDLFKFGSVSGGSSLTTRQQAILDSSEIHVVAFGGSQDSALAAIRSGQLDKFFTAVPATQAVPLEYRVNYLKDGHVAALGIGTDYTHGTCTEVPGQNLRYWRVRLVSLTSNGGCDSADYFRQSYLWMDAGGTTTIWPLLDVEGGPMADTTVDREVVLQLPNYASANAAFTIESIVIPGTAPGTCRLQGNYGCPGPGSPGLERDFSGTDQLDVNPYPFQQTFTLPGANDACTVTFSYQIQLEPVLAPPT